MATRAQQFEILAAGVIYDGSTISTPYVKFLAAGTSAAKDAYADIDKAVAITKKALDTQGRATVYGDGIYKLRFYSGDPDAGGVFKFELDNQKVTAASGDTRTVTSASVTGTVDDSLVVADTTSNNIAYYLPDAALMAGKLLQVAKLVAGNTLTVYPKSGSGQLVNGAASIAYTAAYSTGVFQSDGSNWYVFQTVGDATTLETIPANGFVKFPAETGVNVKFVDIGDWDMDATASVSVAHGLTLSKIRSVSATIRNDADSEYYIISQPGASAYVSYVDTTNVNLGRLISPGDFDNTNFDSTSYNRGWITIYHID